MTRRQKQVFKMLKEGHDICDGFLGCTKYIFPIDRRFSINKKRIKYETFKGLKSYLRRVVSDNVGWWTLKEEFKR